MGGVNTYVKIHMNPFIEMIKYQLYPSNLKHSKDMADKYLSQKRKSLADSIA